MAEDVKDTTTTTDPQEATQQPGQQDPTTQPAAGAQQQPADDAEVQRRADAIVAKKLKGMPSKEEVKAFREWQESQKTPEQKESEALRTAQGEAAQLKTQLEQFQRRDSVIDAGVPAQYAKFVAFEAGQMVTDEVDFEAALAGYLKRNPQYKGEAGRPPVTTQLPQGGNAGGQMSDVERAFYSRNPNLKKE